METTVTISIKDYDSLRNDSTSLKKILSKKTQSFAQINQNYGMYYPYVNIVIYDATEIQQLLLDRIKTIEKEKNVAYNNIIELKESISNLEEKIKKLKKKWYHFF